MSAAAKATRGRPSRIDRLPDEIKARLDELLRGGVTQREILRRLEGPLREIGEAPLSAAGLNRYATRMEAVGRDIRETRAIADAWTARLGERPTSEVGQLTIEILRTLAFRFAIAENDEGESGLDLDEFGDLALALQRLERAAALGTKRERELFDAWSAKVADAAAESGHTLPAEVLEKIRRDVYGIHDGL